VSEKREKIQRKNACTGPRGKANKEEMGGGKGKKICREAPTKFGDHQSQGVKRNRKKIDIVDFVKRAYQKKVCKDRKEQAAKPI